SAPAHAPGAGEHLFKAREIEGPCRDDDDGPVAGGRRQCALRRDEVNGRRSGVTAKAQHVLPASKHHLREFGGVDERRLDDARASLERIADVFADADLHAVGGAGAQIEVIDRDRRSASRTVRRDGGSGPKWRSGNRASLNAELLRLAIEDQVRIARYGVTSVRTYFAIRSNSRFTRSP